MRIPAIIALTLLFTQSQAPKGTIEGRVIRAGTREPVSDVLITLVAPVQANANLAPDIAARLTDQINSLTETGIRGGISQDVIDNAIENARRNITGNNTRPVTAMTDASGRFSFRDLAPGRYTVRAERDGYFASPLNGTASTAANKAFTIQEGKTNPSEDILMVKGAVVSGRIRDPNGQPISAMTVTVYRVTYSNGRRIWSVTNSKTTDDRGEYRIYWLPPGEYYVGVVPRTPTAVPGPQDSWARTFFPGTAEPGTAMPVEVRDGTEAPGVDISIQLMPVAAFKISGVAINNAARPNPANGVIDRSIASFILAPREPGVLDSPNPPTVQNALPATSRGNGEFELRNIRPGAYDIYPVAPVITEAVATPAAGAPALTSLPAALGAVATINGVPSIRRQPTGRAPVEVNRDIVDLRIPVNLGVPFSGEVHVNGTGGQPIKLDSIRLNLRPLDTTPQSFVSLIGTIPVDSAGKFSVANFPEGRYALQLTGLPVSAYVADIRQGGASVMDNGLVMDSAAAPIEVVVDPNGVTVQGTVLNADGKPAANVTVALVPPQGRRQSLLLYKNTVTSETGTFTIRGVMPGTYTIFAWESVLPGAWQNAEFLARYDSRGRPFNVSAGSVAEVQLNVIPLETR